MDDSQDSIPTNPIEPDIPPAVRALLADIDATEFQPFPLDALTPEVSGFVDSASESMGCDPSFLILPILSCAAAAIGDAYEIQLKPGWTEPAIIWTAIIGSSGSMKSPALRAALAPLLQVQDEATAEFERALDEFEKLDPKDRGSPPQLQRYVCSDTTIEALADILVAAPRGLLVYRDELSGWFASFDRYRESKGGEVAQWLQLQSGGTIFVDRKSNKGRPIYIRRPRVSLTGGIQPRVLQKSLGQENFDNGLAARLLMSWPPTRAKSWNENAIDPEDLKRFSRLTTGLLRLKEEHDQNGARSPIVLPLSPEAKSEWIDFFNIHCAEQAEIEDEALKSAWSKLESSTARLALIDHLMRLAYSGDVDSPNFIGKVSIDSAIKIVTWFKRETTRIYQLNRENEKVERRRTLVRAIQKRGGSITANDLRRAMRSIGSAEEARGSLEELVNLGVASWQDRPATKSGGRPTTECVLHPELCQQKPQSLDVDACEEERWAS